MTTIKLFEQEFNDKTFWHLNTEESVISDLVTDHDKFCQQGGRIWVTDDSDNKYIRKITIYAEHSNEAILTMFAMRQNSR